MRILIVIDMQNDFITGSLGSNAAIGIVKNVVEKIRSYNERNDLVIATLDTHTDKYLDSLEGKNLPIIHCVKGTKGHDINEEVKKNLNKNTIYIEKNGFASFEMINFIKNHLQKYKINDSDLQIEIVGLCTDICVISGAILLRAMFPDTKIAIDQTCCAATSKEKHRASIEVMKSCQIDIV